MNNLKVKPLEMDDFVFFVTNNFSGPLATLKDIKNYAQLTNNLAKSGLPNVNNEILKQSLKGIKID